MDTREMLRAYRLRNGLTFDQVATKLPTGAQGQRWHASYVSHVEAGRIDPSPAFSQALAALVDTENLTRAQEGASL